jgi:hypothetical protein
MGTQVEFFTTLENTALKDNDANDLKNILFIFEFRSQCADPGN